jgi:hypothetical protein
MMIPAFLSIDVEPDGFQLTRRDPPSWAGYTALADYAECLRTELNARTGRAPRFGWYFRTDPQIAEIHGRPDHALVAFPERTAGLRAAGDYLGVHAHPIRWAEDRRMWVHEFVDGDWPAQAARFALDAFQEWAGTPARHFRAGAGFLTNRIVEAVDQAGVAVDLTLEPVTGWGTRASVVPTGLDSSAIVGSYTDCGGAPRVPYRPSRNDFRVDGGKRGRRLVLVPLTSRALPSGRPWWWRAARRVVRGRRPPPVQMLYPSATWPSPQHFWDLVQSELGSMRHPYLSLGVRTDSATSDVAAKVRRIFDALPAHPLARKLRFEDPLTALPILVQSPEIDDTQPSHAPSA